MTDYKATPEQWAAMERWALEMDNACSCIIELRARVEALEANAKPTPNDLPIRSSTEVDSLVERVRNAIASEYDPKDYCWDEARAAIREVAAFLREKDVSHWASADLLEVRAEL